MDAVVVALAGIFALVAGLLFVLPRLTVPSVRFGVRVPSVYERHPVLAAAERTYSGGILLSAVAGGTALSLGALGFGVGWAVAALPILLGGAFATYVYVRTEVLETKRRERWAATGARIAVGGLRSDAEEPAVWPWAMPAVAVWFALLVAALVIYPSLPAQLPTHFDAAGHPDAYSAKSPTSVFFGVAAGGVLLVVFGLLGFAIPRTRATLDPERPEEDSQRQRIFRRRMSRALLLLGATVEVSLAVADLLVWQVFPPTEWTFGALLAPILVGVALLVGVSVTTGQLGSRLNLRPVPSTTGLSAPPPLPVCPRDDDALWRAGVLYYNPEDGALLVPKRFGVGWTLNFGNPWSWLIVAALLALPLLTVLGAATSH